MDVIDQIMFQKHIFRFLPQESIFFQNTVLSIRLFSSACQCPRSSSSTKISPSGNIYNLRLIFNITHERSKISSTRYSFRGYVSSWEADSGLTYLSDYFICVPGHFVEEKSELHVETRYVFLIWFWLDSSLNVLRRYHSVDWRLAKRNQHYKVSFVPRVRTLLYRSYIALTQ